jgi:integrase/recombinase XerD
MSNLVATATCGLAHADNAAPDWHAGHERLRGAYADTSINGYAKDYRLFETWCAANRLGALPATPETIAAYLDEFIQELSSATLVRRVAAITRVHRVLDLPNPSDAEIVRLALRRIKRFRPNRPKQALGITRNMRKTMLDSCGDDLAGKRDKALVALGFEGLCRRSELAALNVDDVVENERGEPAILIRRGKADQNGDGRIITLSAATAQIVLEWVEAGALGPGPLFRPVYRGKPITRHLAGYSICRLLKTIAERAGVTEKQVASISGHSLRVGAAQTLLQDGHDVLRLMKVGGWRSATTVFRYIERAEISVWA